MGSGPGGVGGGVGGGWDVTVQPTELTQKDLCSACASLYGQQVQAINQSNRFEAEIREEQESKKKELEEKKTKQAAFRELQSAFK